MRERRGKDLIDNTIWTRYNRREVTHVAQEDLSRILACALNASHILLENGAETYRAEESAVRICKRFGVESPQVLALPTGVFITLNRDEHAPVSGLKRVRRRSTDLTVIDRVMAISRGIESGDIPLSDAASGLAALSDAPKGKRFQGLLPSAASSGFFAMLFGGNWFDFLVAALCGLAVEGISARFGREDSLRFVVSLLGGAIIALFATALTALTGLGSQTAIIAGALMPLLPGLAMINAIRDTMHGDLVSGVARAAEALLIAVSLAAGVGVILGAGMAIGGWLA